MEHPLSLGVGRVEQLETAVEPKAVDAVGAHATAHGIACFKDHCLMALLRRVFRGREAGEARSHDDDVHAVTVAACG